LSTFSALNICEIDSQYTSQSNPSSCDCGNYGSKVNNCFINFASLNGAVVRGSVVSSAVLRLAQVSGGYSRQLPIRITLRSGEWGAFTWNSQPPDTGAWNPNTSLTGSGSGARDFNVTSLVQWIANNSSGAHIWKLERVPNDTSGADDAKRFSTTAGNHQLIVDYTAPTPPGPVTGLSIQPGIFEGSPILRWTPGAPGYNNPPISYDVYRQKNGGSLDLLGNTGNTSWTVDISGIERGATLAFRVDTRSNYSPPVPSGSVTATRNRVPNTPTIAALAKSVYVPGDTVRVNFTGSGDADGNLKGFEVETSGSATLIQNASGMASYVDVNTTGWPPGVSYTFRVRAYDACEVRSAWSSAVSALVGLPMKIMTTEGGAFKQVAQMKLFPTEGSSAKTVKSMKAVTTQGGGFKTVF
jgi:hypothetical protein